MNIIDIILYLMLGASILFVCRLYVTLKKIEKKVPTKTPTPPIENKEISIAKVYTEFGEKEYMYDECEISSDLSTTLKLKGDDVAYIPNRYLVEIRKV